VLGYYTFAVFFLVLALTLRLLGTARSFCLAPNAALLVQATSRVLLTGGASCPDGLIQQVVTRINSFFPPAQLHGIETVLAGLPALKT